MRSSHFGTSLLPDSAKAAARCGLRSTCIACRAIVRTRMFAVQCQWPSWHSSFNGTGCCMLVPCTAHMQQHFRRVGAMRCSSSSRKCTHVRFYHAHWHNNAIGHTATAHRRQIVTRSPATTVEINGTSAQLTIELAVDPSLHPEACVLLALAMRYAPTLTYFPILHRGRSLLDASILRKSRVLASAHRTNTRQRTTPRTASHHSSGLMAKVRNVSLRTGFTGASV